MTDQRNTGTPQAGDSTIKRALSAIDRLQARLDASDRARTEPIAIVGLACRFPGGATSPDAYWRLLADGAGAITGVPRDRWDIDRYYDPDPDAPGRMYTRHGGFLDDVAGFDSWFFRISPREAQRMDPQQRLLLEVAWEAIEDAGIDATRLHGSATGVFVGITTNDYAHLLMQASAGGGEDLDAFFFTGNPSNAAAGRLSYAFGLQGPAMAIDTACSSSLAAVHQACLSLRAGECRAALAGGVNLVLAPETTVAVCRTRALSPDGQCRTFDAGANGFVRSEGCGLVLLKRLSDAIADGDPIRAVIRGSAINQDGATSGFTVPNGHAQQRVIAQALGGLAPDAITYLEAHGTGTPLGDPIEVGAAAAALGRDRDPAHPLYIGSVKANIGHAEAAAGIAALIKTVLAIERGAIPPHRYTGAPNPLIPWDTLPVRIPRALTPWPEMPTRLAGVSAFGASGTNAHVILEQAPAAQGGAAELDTYVLPLSAKRPEALAALAARYREYLATTSDAFADICQWAAIGRAHHQHRVAIVASTVAEALTAFEEIEAALAAGGAPIVAPLTAAGVGSRAAALAAAYAAGDDVDWRELYAPDRRRIAPPLYPFQHTRYWIPTKDNTMPITHTPAAVAPGAPPRREAVLALLRGYIAGLLQAPESEINVHLPFLEMGADSLVMVDAIGLVEKEYGLKVAIRRFFEDLSTIDALATFIDASLPPDAPSTSVAPAAAAPAAPLAMSVAQPVAVAGDGSLGHMVVEQTRLLSQLMAQQAEILRVALGQPASIAAPAAIAAAPDPSGIAKPMMPFGNPIEIRARGLTTAQHAHLEALIARYTARTPKSKAKTQEYRSVLADSRATVGFRLSTKEMLYPIWGAKSDGSRVWDIDGNEYIDYTMGFGVHLFGHKPDFVQHALREDLDRAVELGARADVVGEVAQLFTELTGLDRVAFSNSGTEAVMAAVRLARARTGRDKLVVFTNAYHGHADTTLARAQKPNSDLASLPMAPGVPAGLAADIVVLEYGSDEALEIIERRGHEIAAVMVEPVQSRHLKQQPREFLHDLRRITRDTGSALIFDEMITGFRAHLGGAQGYFGVKADLATYGKIVGGGMPIGLVAGSADFMDGVDGGMWQYGDGSFPAADRTAFGGTFCQHPLSMAAARATLLRLKEEGPGLQQRLNDRTAGMVRALNDYFREEEVPIEATHFSSLFRFEFSSNLDLLFYHMLEKGIYIWEWRSCFLSTAHSDADVTRFIDVVKESVADLRRGGFAARLPGPASPSVTGPITHDRTGTARVPLSDAQRQLWTLLQIDHTSSMAYNVSTTLELDGVLDADRLRAALQRITDRHGALRTTIDPDGAAQIVHPRVDLTVPLVDLSASADRDGAFASWRESMSREPIDLVRGPVFRARLVRLAPTRHVLMLTAHHILADGMTMGVVMKELAAFYNEPDGDAGVPPSPMQFSDYLALRDGLRGTPEMTAHRAFWAETFADGAPQLNLPLDRVRPPVKTYAGGRVTTRVDAGTLRAIKQAGRAQGCTLNMTLTAAFALLLHRWAVQDDLVLGTSVTGRPFPGSLDVAGYCTHLVPVRSRLEGDPSFADLLKTTRRLLLDVLDHQDLPFAELLSSIPAPRSAGAFPLISAVFNLEPVSTLPALAGLTSRLLPQAVSFTPFDLFVNVTDEGDTLLVDTDFNADLFDAATIERMMRSFDTLLRAAGASPAMPARALPLLTDAEREQILVRWNDTSKSWPADAFVHTHFEQCAVRTPDAIAVQAEHGTLTYAALNARANQLAQWLRTKGAGPGVLVGVCCERSLEMLTAIVAVLKAGGAYVPLDPDYPADRLAFMIADANVPVILTQAHLRDRVQHVSGAVFALDTEWAAVADLDDRNLDLPVAGDQPAYMIYTSGSTGRPKGALNSHRGIANRLLWMQDAFGLTPADRVLQKTPFSFDVSVWELLWPLMTGARVVMARPGGHRDPQYLARLIDEAGITTVHFVPSMLNVFLESLGLVESPEGGGCASLARIICSGEALTPDLVRRTMATLAAPLFNLYGPTEAAVDVTWWPCDLDTMGSTVPIGTPIANTQIYVLDARLQPVPAGVTGEIYIGGVNVGLGYLNRPELTAERFLPDPFKNDAPGARLYRTGDLGRFRPDGTLDYLGRIDTQVKVRGFRIELGEIEAVLAAHPAVASAVVIAEPTPAGDTRLAAYVAASRPSDTLSASLREHASRALPDYMVPPAIVVLDEIPLLPNGKIDRGRLPQAHDASAHVAPAPGLEAGIAAIWEDVLRQAPVGATDDFFALGGNSLSASQVVARVAQRLDARIGIREMFAYPTVRGLATAIGRIAGRGLPPIVPIASQADYAVSNAQRRFWVQDRLASSGGGNTQPASFLIEGPLDVAALERAFRSIVARHEILRTVFVDTGGEPRQKVLAPEASGFTLGMTTLEADADAAAVIREREREEGAARMDLTTGPLLRAHLIAIAPERHVCICSMHHAITDGWSVGVMLNDLAVLYDAEADGKASPLTPLPIQYKDYAAWQNHVTSGPDAEPMRAYWREKLGGVPPLKLAADFKKAAPFARAVHEFTVDPRVAAGLASVARRSGATLYMALLACLKVLLYRHSAQEDIAIGTPVSARPLPELESQIGPYLNIVALRDRVAGDDTLGAVLTRVRETALDGFAHQLYPFDRIVDDLRIKRVAGRNPLFDVGFTLQNQDEVQARETSRHLRMTELAAGQAAEDPEAPTDLWFVARASDRGLAVQVVYNGARFRPERIDRLSQDFAAIAAAAAASLDARVDAVALASSPGPRARRTVTIDLGL